MNSNLILSIILIIGVVQGIFLSIVLITIKRGNRTANKILAEIVSLFTIMLLPHAGAENPSSQLSAIWGVYFIHLLFFVLSPLIYFYVKTVTKNSGDLNFHKTIHILPFGLFLLIGLLLMIFKGSVSLLHLMEIIMTITITIQMTFYLYLSLKILTLHSINISSSYSYYEKMNLNWLKFLLWAQIIIWPSFLLAEAIHFEQRDSIWVLLAIFIYLMGYFGLVQPEIFIGELITENKVEDKIKKKYAKSTLTNEMADEYYNRLLEVMENKKPYLQNDLTLQSLAALLCISQHHLSQVINDKCRQNFFEFINDYRIEDAKLMLRNPDKNYLSVAAIGLEAGFNSISSFNTIFKKITNTTPSQFRKSSLQP